MKFLSFLILSLAATVQINGYPQRTGEGTYVESQRAPHIQKNNQNKYEDSDMLMEETEQSGESSSVSIVEPREESQTYFPSFSPFNTQPLGHSRPLYYQPEAAYSHRPTAFQQHLGFDSNARFSGYKGDVYEERSDANSILGSGNFGVIKGGTFFNENDDDQYGYSDNFRSYYHNGHGRPSFHFGESNRRPQQFENFRDFADINTPSYSQFVVVYANKNETSQEEKKSKQPKNIIERLAMLDLEQSTVTESATAETIPSKKMSKSKRKLALRKLGKKDSFKAKTVHRDLYEPLLALS